MSDNKLEGLAEDQKNSASMDRRTFMRSTVTASLGVGLLSAIGQQDAAAQSRVRLSNIGLKKYLVTTKPDGKEVEMEIEGSTADGQSDVTRFFGRWINAGDSYYIFGHLTASRFQPESTFTVSGKRGEVEVDYRYDDMSMVIVSANGTIHRLEEPHAKVPIKGLYPGVSGEERINQFLHDDKSGHSFWQQLALL